MIQSINDLLTPNQLLFLFFGFFFFGVLLHNLMMIAVAPREGRDRPVLLNVTSSPYGLSFFFGSWALLSAYFIKTMGLEFSIVGVELALAVLLALIHPAFAFSLFVSLFILRPWEIYPDSIALLLPKVMMGLCVLSVAFEWVRARRIEILWTKAATALALFLVWVYLSTFMAPDPKALQAEFFDSLFKVLIVFLLCQNILRSEWAYKVLAGSIAISAIGLGATAILYSSMFGGEEAAETGRLVTVGMLGNSNDIAAVLILGFPFALGPFLRGSRDLISSATATVAVAVTAASVWFTRSRGALLALIISFGALIFLKSQRKWLVVFVMGFALIISPVLVKTLGRASDDLEQSSESRLNYWITGVRMAMDNPLLGVGYEQYPKNYEMFAPNLRYEWGERTAHSSWVLILGETGVPGLILFTIFVSIAMNSAYRNWNRRPEIFLAFVGYFAAISFLSHSYLIFPYLLAGVTLAPDLWERESC